MLASADVQQKFIQQLKEKLPAHVSLPDEIAELLNISVDSAYRRIRGDTLFSLAEILLLSSRFGVSLDGLANSSDYVTFQFIPIDHKTYNVERLFEVILRDLDEASKVNDAELYYLARDIPIFHLMQFPEISAFKIFFWEKIHGDPDLTTEKFHPGIVNQDLTNLGRKIWLEYVKFSSTEIWGLPTVEAFLQEIAFMWDSSQIESKAVATGLCNKVIELIKHVKKQAELGCKFSHGTTPIERPDNLKLYVTDIQLTHNKVLIKGDIKRVYMPTLLDTLITSNENYYQRNFQMLQNSIKRSTLISVTGEKARNQFIDGCITNANKLLARIEAS